MIKSSLGKLLCALPAAGAAIASAAAAEFISHRYDGDYRGEARVSPVSSEASCAPLALARLEIRNGILRGYAPGGRQSVKGFVTADGFFTADYIFPDGRTTLFEGLVDARGKLTAGVVDGECAWIVDLAKQRGRVSA